MSYSNFRLAKRSHKTWVIQSESVISFWCHFPWRMFCNHVLVLPAGLGSHHDSGRSWERRHKVEIGCAGFGVEPVSVKLDVKVGRKISGLCRGLQTFVRRLEINFDTVEVENLKRNHKLRMTWFQPQLIYKRSVYSVLIA